MGQKKNLTTVQVFPRAAFNTCMSFAAYKADPQKENSTPFT